MMYMVCRDNLYWDLHQHVDHTEPGAQDHHLQIGLATLKSSDGRTHGLLLSHNGKLGIGVCSMQAAYMNADLYENVWQIYMCI